MMAATSHHVWNPGSTKSSEDEYWRWQCQQKEQEFLYKSYGLLCSSESCCGNCNSKVGPACPLIMHKITKESLWIYGLYSPSWVCEELFQRGLTHPHDGQAYEKDEAAAFVASLRSCAKNKDLSRGTRLHDDILKRGLLEQCSDALVTLYAKCGALAKAEELLDLHKSRDVFSWTTLIAGYARQGRSQDALNCFERMQCEGISPNAVTFACILK
eukprot:c24737_g4_i4 orf=112-753(+)